MAKKEDSSIAFGLGLLAGVVAGIVAGIVYAPKSGEETREDLICKAKQIKENFPDDLEKAKKNGLTLVELLKIKTEKIIDNINDSLKAKQMAKAKREEEKVYNTNY
ncbi:MAG: YtxH domain-containing protein [Candidatus Gastranaerophilales bacterium]|nr:YtxH domain-containing protein [Candidatus Gastranaerophilales bacterium]